MQPVIKDTLLEVPINATKERVWQAIWSELPDWWPQDFLCFPDGDKIKFEARPGGRLYEETADGRGILWAHVVMIVPGEAIEFAGIVTPTFGGPNMTTYRFEVKEASEGCLFRLSGAILGNLSEEGQASIAEGWKYLILSGLKAHIEGSLSSP